MSVSELDPSEWDDPECDPSLLDEARRAGSGSPVPWSDLAAVQLSATRKWFAEGAIEGNPIVMLSGPEKKGKSWLAIQLAVATIAGDPWLGAFPLRRPHGSPIYLDAEYGRDEFARRVTRVARGERLPPHVALNGIRHLESTGVPLDRESKAFRDIVRECERLPPTCVIIDPFRNHLDGAEEKSEDVLKAFTALSWLRERARCPIVCLHHVNKGGSTAGSRVFATRPDLLIEGSDAAVPVYSTRGRSMRAGDRLEAPFTVTVTHEHDDDDTVAVTKVRWVAPKSKGSKDLGPRERVRAAVTSEPRTMGAVRAVANVSGQAAERFIDEFLFAKEIEIVKVSGKVHYVSREDCIKPGQEDE